MANAKEMASGTGSRVNKDPESLLRYGLPIDNKEVRTLVDVVVLRSIFHSSLRVIFDMNVDEYHFFPFLRDLGQRTSKIYRIYTPQC